MATQSPENSEALSTRSSGSSLADALASVGDRWTLLIVATLLDGPRRFGELQDELDGIAPNVLSSRLRELEAEGLVVTEPYSERPPRFVYELTGEGIRVVELATVIMAPYATQLLGDLGATVVKVETGRGDGSRVMGGDSNLVRGTGSLELHCPR